MKTAVFLAVALLLTAGAGTSPATVLQSGNIIVEYESYVPGQAGPAVGIPASQLLVNPGFETGDLSGWTTSTWYVTGQDFHSGVWCAESEGNQWLMQEFCPADVRDVTLISLWSRQPDGPAFQAVDFFYGTVDFDEFLISPPNDWSYWDLTSMLRTAGTLTGIRIWGYSGGPPSPDITRVDDVLVDAVGASAIEETTWGSLKDLYQ